MKERVSFHPSRDTKSNRSSDPEQYRSISYDEVIPVLVEAINSIVKSRSFEKNVDRDTEQC